MHAIDNYTDYTLDFTLTPMCPQSLIPVDFSIEPPIVLLYGEAEKILVSFILPVIVIFGILSNSAFLFVLLRVPHMRNATNCFLANLAVCDTLYIMVAGGEKFTQYLNSSVNGNNDFLGDYGCAIVSTVIYASYFVSFVFVTLVSVERFFAVKYPLQHRSVTRKARTVFHAVCSWILGGILCGLYVSAYSELKRYCIIWPDHEPFRKFPNVIGICGSSQTWKSHLALSIIFSSYVLSLVINFSLYSCIISSLHQRAVTEERTSLQRNYNHVISVRNQVAKMLIVNGVVFFVCQTPYRILSFLGIVLNEEIGDAVWFHPVVRISHMLLYLNSAINAVIYTIGSECYRLAFREAFLGKQNPSPLVTPLVELV